MWKSTIGKSLWSSFLLIAALGARNAEPRGSAEPPITCTLDAFSAADRERYDELRSGLLSATIRVQSTRRGWAVELSGGERSFREAAEWITLERRCCGFMEFGLDWTPGGNPRVTLEGPPAVREIIAAEFGFERAKSARKR